MSSFVLTSLSKSDVVRPGPDSEEGEFESKDRRTTIDRNFVDVLQLAMLLHVGNVFEPFFLDLLHLSDLRIGEVLLLKGREVFVNFRLTQDGIY